MEWATRGKYIDGSFFVEVQSGSNVDIVRLSELGARGLPTPDCTKRRVVVTDFATWHQAFSAEYQGAFGITAVSDGHQVFEFTANGRRYVVPALALMRGLFRPNRHVLAEMFKPQGLERVCYPILAGDFVSVAPIKRADSFSLLSILQPLAWMYSFPSARQMCGSVHELMVGLQIGLSLPIGKARMALHYIESGTNNYVTSLTLVTFDSGEDPYEFAANQPRHIDFHEGLAAASGRVHRQCVVDDSIPRHPDGSTDISNAEWLVLEPLFASRRTNAKHHPRMLLDSILAKLIGGTAWRKASYKEGTWVNASAWLQQLQKSGQWAVIVETLKALRVEENEYICS